MSKLTFLSVDEAIASNVPWPDVYYTPHYGSAVQCSDQGTWEVAVWSNGPILYPYLKRPIDPDLSPDGLFDVVSPYGYSGIWAPEDLPASEWREFRRVAREQLRQRGAVAEFLRIGGLVNGRDKLLEVDQDLDALHHNDTVTIDVGRTYDECWAAAESRSRTKTRKARRLGYTWSTRAATTDDIAPGSTFRSLYEQTMARVHADKYYFFPDDYYRRLLELPESGLRYLQVSDADQCPAAAGIFMCWKPLLHLHLVGSLPQATRDGAGNMVYDGLIRWACENPDLTTMHVGGGMSADDRLFYFKRGFGGEPVPFWIARSILDHDRNRMLIEQRARRLRTSAEQLEATGYFPTYRASAA